MKTVLSIAGSDPTGGAGIQGDLKTFAAHRVFGMAALTAVIAQNSMGVPCFEPVSPALLESQIEAVCADIACNAVKIGLLPTAEAVLTVESAMARHRQPHVVIDPVLMSSTGKRFLHRSDTGCLFELFSRAELITPNVPEANELSGLTIETERDLEQAASIIRKKAGKRTAILLKGGHFGLSCDDYLLDDDGGRWIRGERLEGTIARGTGCALSSAIASNLALGYTLEGAIYRAKVWLREAMRTAPSLGKGAPPLNHSVQYTG